MKRKKMFLAAFASLFVAGAFVFSACGEDEGGIAFSLDGGGNVPQTMEAELGELFIMPKVAASVSGLEVEVEIEVFDSENESVDLINKKFKATDPNGYTVVFTAKNGEKTKKAQIKVTVKDTKAPTFNISGTSGSVALLGETVEIPECKVDDAATDALQASYTVKDANQNAVAVTDGKFVASLVGDYTITYTATDPSGNVGTKDFIVSCKNAVVLNAFENENDVSFAQFDVESKEVVLDVARNGNALKIVLSDPQSSESNWRRICIPFAKEDGGYRTWEELQEFAGIQYYIYSSVANEIGLMTFVRPIEVGWNTVYYTMEEIASVREKYPSQYEENENGFFLNLKFSTPGSYLIFDQMIGIYPDDYVPKAKITLDDGSELPETYDIDMNETFTLPDVTAIRDKKEMELTVVVKDSEGKEIEITDNVFAATDLNGYTIVYTATDENGSATKEIKINVIDTRIPNVKVNGVRNLTTVGSEFVVPDSTVKIDTGETLTATVTVKDPNGDPVELKDGKFVAAKAGEYTLVYKATSEENGLSGSAEFVVTCTEGVLLNGFDKIEDITWAAFENTKERVAENGIYGVKLTNVAATASSWRSIRFPLRDETGEFLSWDDLQDFARLDIYAYLSADMNLGLANGVKSYSAGKVVLSFTMAELLAAKERGQYAENANGFYLNLQTATPGDYIVLENVVAVYPDGYVPAVKMTTDGGEALPEQIDIAQGGTVTLPVVKAMRKKSSEEMTVTVKVIDSDGNEIPLADNSFVATDLKGYTVIFTATDELGSDERRITVNVSDSRVPLLNLTGNGGTVYKGDLVPIPKCTATFEENALPVTIAVKDKNGNAVALTDGAFEATIPGVYTVVYSAEASNGNTTEEKIEFVCVNGKLLNGFGATDCVGWTAAATTKEVVNGGLKVTWTAAKTWVRVCVPLRKADGAYYTWDELLEFDKIEIRFTLSSGNGVGLVSGGTIKTFSAGGGECVLVYTKAELEAEMAANSSLYAANANGLYITVKTAAVNEYVVFNSVVGQYAEETSSGGDTTVNTVATGEYVGFDLIAELHFKENSSEGEA